MNKDKDPAFLFYDGDAARDVSHMNRLERGCYFDLIQAQRKFRGITMEQARKILGKDFQECWPSIEMILTLEADGKYHIAWLTDSMKSRAEYSEKQRKRIQDYWDKRKKEENEKEVPRKYRGISTVIPIENEDENEIENEIEKVNKGGVGGKKLFSEMATRYCDWYEKKVGVKYPFRGSTDGKAINLLIADIRGAIEKKNGGEATEAEIIEGFEFILNHHQKWERFYQSQLKLTQVAYNLANIIANIKGIGKYGKASFTDIAEETRRAVDALCGGK